MTGSLVAKAEGEPTLCSRRARAKGQRCAVFSSRSRGASADTVGKCPRRSTLGARATWSYVAESATVADVSSLVALVESVAVAGALVFGAWAWRSRGAATKRIAALSAQLEEQRSTGERREGLLRTVVETTPVAIVLFGEAGSIVFTNRSARELFFEGMAVEGENFLSMIERAPPLAAPGASLRGRRAVQRRGSGRARDVSPVAPTPRWRPDADRGQERHAGDQSTRGREPQEGHPHHRSRDQQLARPHRVVGELREDDPAKARAHTQAPGHVRQDSRTRAPPARLPRRVRPAREDPSAESLFRFRGVPSSMVCADSGQSWRSRSRRPGPASSTAPRFSRCSSTSSRTRMKWEDRRIR